MSVPNNDIIEHLIPFYKTAFEGSAAEEYAYRSIECLEELIAIRAELETARALLAAYRDVVVEMAYALESDVKSYHSLYKIIHAERQEDLDAAVLVTCVPPPEAE